MLVMAEVLVATIVGCVHHVMLRGGLLTALADRHAGRGEALQRQPQHDEDQNEVTQKKRHFSLLALRGNGHNKTKTRDLGKFLKYAQDTIQEARKSNLLAPSPWCWRVY